MHTYIPGSLGASVQAMRTFDCCICDSVRRMVHGTKAPITPHTLQPLFPLPYPRLSYTLLILLLSLVDRGSFHLPEHLSKMARKSEKWTEVLLRKAIGDAIYSRHLQNQPIDRKAIKKTYLKKNPNHADFIRAFVDR